MTGKIYVLVDGGVVQGVLTDDPALERLEVIVIDSDCDEHTGAELVKIDRDGEYEADAIPWLPQFAKIAVRDNPEKDAPC
jgi:hypothetical protein